MILFSYGTRPEYIKLISILIKFKNYKLVYTGQHAELLNDQGLKYDYKLNIPNSTNNRLDTIVTSILNNDYIFENVTHVLVQGDTTSAMAIALAAFHRNLKVIHLEAGLRTWDKHNPYPEETNRQIISSLADIHLCPTQQNKKNLIKEKRQGTIFIVGNSGLDNLNTQNIRYNNEVIITLHRRENHCHLKEYFLELSKQASIHNDLKFLFISHPNPNVQNNLCYLNNIDIIKPMSHIDMINKIKCCRFIISDSGGLQEESAFLRKKIIVCRKKTERIESLNITSFLCPAISDLAGLIDQLKINYIVNSNIKCPYGNGKSYKKIIKILNQLEK